MYKKAEQLPTESENFELPFGGKLRMRSGRVPRPWKRTKQAEDNRWVMMAKLIPCLDSLNRRGTRRARIAGQK